MVLRNGKIEYRLFFQILKEFPNSNYICIDECMEANRMFRNAFSSDLDLQMMMIVQGDYTTHDVINGENDQIRD